MQNRLVLILGAGVVVVAGAAAAYFLMQPSAAPSTAPAPPPVISTPKPTAAPIDTPKPTAAPVTPKPAVATPTPEAAPTMGTLVFESDVPDTSVFIDRVYIGTAPVTAHDVKPGTHSLRLSATGYDGFAETIEVVPGTKTLSYKFKELRLDASIAVVHKHGIGSCAGTLRATPKGLTYETTNKDDGFTAALTDLETFTVDYIQKNLRVKIKNGKSFNFTDKDGNADKLYLFHGEVEKVRQKLIGK